MLLVLLFYTALACDFMVIPDDLTYFSPSFPVTNVIEGSGRFLMPLRTLEWTIEVAQESWMRVSVEPKMFSLHLSLNSKIFIESKTGSTDEIAMMSRKMKADTYVLKLDIASISSDDSGNSECNVPNMFFNFALFPIEKLAGLLPSITDYTEGFPDLTGSNDFLTYSAFVGSYPRHYVKLPSGQNTIYAYDFDLPGATDNHRVVGITGLWKLTLTISHSFLNSGGIRMILSPSTNKQQNSANCIGSGQCITGKRDQKNAITLNSVLNQGSYRVVVYYDTREDDKEMFELIGEKIPISVDISFMPMIEKEDRLNCIAGVLPSDLDSSGISYQGFIRFKDNIFADFMVKSLKTKFKATMTSMFRVVTQAPEGLKVSIQLLNSVGEVVIESKTPGKTNSLHKEIRSGEYILDFSILNSFKDSTTTLFCETFSIEIGLTPKKHFKQLPTLQPCNTKSALDSLFSSIHTSLASNPSFTIKLSEPFYLPPSDTVLYKSTFEVPSLVYIYTEVFSDFLAADLQIIINSAEEPVLSTSTTKYLHGSLDPGVYTFSIHFRSKSFDISECISFNLRLELAKTTDKALNSWKCHSKFCQKLPSNLNTFDKLGPKETLQEILPPVAFYSDNLYAPNSNRDVKDKCSFTVQTASRLKVFIENEESEMKIELLEDDSVVFSSKDRLGLFPYVYSLGFDLKPSVGYEVVVYYYPKNAKICHVYTAAIEIYPIIQPEPCSPTEIDETVFFSRTLDTDFAYDFISPTGFSPIDPTFSHFRSKDPLEKRLTMRIPQQSVITGHLISNNFGLAIEIYQNGELKDWGSYSAIHRYQLKPTPLAKGEYEVIIKDYFTSNVKECVNFSLSILMETLEASQNIQSMLRKTGTCSSPDQPGSLNTIGQLESGSLHFHKFLEMETEFTYLSFKVVKESLLRIFITPMEEIEIEISVLDSKLQLYTSSKVENHSNGVHKMLSAGEYTIEVHHGGIANIEMNCPSFEIDLEIISREDYESLSSLYDCSTSQGLSSLQAFDNICILYDSSLLNTYVPIELFEDSEVIITISYSNALSGYISLLLSDDENSKILQSIGSENICQLKGNLPKGKYQIDIITSQGTDTTHPCWPLMISIDLKASENTCNSAILPARIIWKYGGPQNIDGTVSFYGVFKVNINSDIIFIEAPRKVLIRVAAISHSADVFIELELYKNSRLTESVAESENELTQSGFVVELPANKDGYYLVVTYVTQETESCLTYELKIVVEAIPGVINLLECRVKTYLNTLPNHRIVVSDAMVTGGDEYAIFDKWILERDRFPPGVKVDPDFTYTIFIEIQKSGLLSIETLYNFLTNSISLELFQNSKQISKGKWDSISNHDSGTLLNFATIISGLPIQPGSYELHLKLPISSNKLIKKYTNSTVCFPFTFELEFIPEPVTKKSLLIQVEPDHSTHLDPAEPLVIKLTFNKAVEEIDVYLLSSSGDKVKPSSVKILQGSEKVKAKFAIGSFIANNCYELKIQGTDIEEDGFKHSYCTKRCVCNPNSNAVCSDEFFTCICEEPYKGFGCFECISGFYSRDSKCIELSTPIVEITKLSFDKPSIMKGEKINLLVSFSTRPYDKSSVKIEKIQSENPVSSSFALVSGAKRIPATSASGKGTDGITWIVEFDSHALDGGKIYTLSYTPSLLFDDSNNSFQYSGSLPTIQVESSTGCVNGLLKNFLCTCFKGYEGPSCNDCSIGFERKHGESCLEISNPTPDPNKSDPEAYIVSSSPLGRSTIFTKSPLTITFKFSQQAFTSTGLPISPLSNSAHLLKSFSLNPASNIPLYPSTAFCIDATSCSIEFSIVSVTEYMDYKLIQHDKMLFTKNGLEFSSPKANMPRFIFYFDEYKKCGGHGKFDKVCVCDKGYSGEVCDVCDPRFELQGGGCVETQESRVLGLWGTLVCGLGCLVAVVAIWAVVRWARSRPKLGREFEMFEKYGAADDIDLYSDI